MKKIFEYIEEKSKEFDQRPIFAHLRDESIGHRQRLRFVPTISHFVMTFADLYNFFLRDPVETDRFQQLSNTHLSEEATHWKWFLADLKALDLNPTMAFTDALRLIWSDDTRRTRTLAYSICQLSGGLTSLEKLVMVLAIEATGRVALEAAVPVGRDLEKAIGRKLVYFGEHHLITEQKHTIEEGAVRESLEGLALDQAQLDQLRLIVDQVFAHFSAFVDEAFELAADEQPFARLAASNPTTGTTGEDREVQPLSSP